MKQTRVITRVSPFDHIQHRLRFCLRLRFGFNGLTKLSEPQQQVSIIRRIRQAVLFAYHAAANQFFDLTVKGLHAFSFALFHRIDERLSFCFAAFNVFARARCCFQDFDDGNAAISVARSLGLTKLAMPSAGNAASALAAYAAASGLEASIFMPQDVPLANRVECASYGAKVTLVNGLISDCARIVAERKHKEGWFDLSTLKEPYRVEGKKTMAYELFEQLGGKLPDAIIFPCGGGVGVIAMWKAFEEMEQLGWINSVRPKMIVVQAAGCAPLVKAWQERKSLVETWPDASTVAAGLRVPRPYGDYLVIKALQESQGTAVSVTDEEIMSSLKHWARVEGIFAAPEGAASLAAYSKLISQRTGRVISEKDRVVLFNTGSGLKYLDVIR